MKASANPVKIGIRLSFLVVIFVVFSCTNYPAAPVLPTARNSYDTRTAIVSTPPDLSGEPTKIISPIAGTSTRDPIVEMIGKVDRNRVLNNLGKLTGEESVCDKNGCYNISNRFTGSRELDWAKDYINNELSGSGFSIEVFEWSLGKYADQNIIASKAGVSLPNEKTYIVAHLDGTRSIWSKKFPAADDNASGVVDLLEVARVLDQYSFNKTVVLFFSTGEEQGKLGVKSYLDQLSPEELSSIKYVVNVDMIGYDANGDSSMELWHGGHTPSMEFAEFFQNTIRDYELALASRFVVGCG